jgi:hypothetical protein
MMRVKDPIQRMDPSPPKRRRRGEGVGMRTFIMALIGLIAGVVAGLVLSEITGIIGFLLFDSVVGIKFLPIYLAIQFAVVAPILDRRIRRRSRRPTTSEHR